MHNYENFHKVKEMIERKKKSGWEFIFMGANIDAAAEAKRFGIDSDHSVNYHCDSTGTVLNYEVMSDVVCSFRKGSGISKSWKKRIDDDFNERKKPR